MPKLERDYYNSLCRGANLEGWALYRIGDGTWGKKPFDISGVSPHGEAVALEVKRVESTHPLTKKLPWHQFAAHQLNWLKVYASRPLSLAIVALACDIDHSVTLFHLHDPEFENIPAAMLSPCLLLTTPRGYVGWEQVLRKRDRRQVMSVLETMR